ncbi:MAG: DUF4159 domain-containing protein [Armatimonadetes bacterium]|nr:DUF4159 domain-containing protein [Armatimonadota bacterium]
MSKTRTNRWVATALGASLLALVGMALARPEEPGSRVRCANLVYAGNKTSVCFSDRFLRRLELETNIRTESKFARVRLDSAELYEFPFAIMTGEGGFTLTPRERVALRHYVTSGGFLLASAGCSDPEWSRSFRTEMGKLFPKQKLTPVPIGHPMFRTVYSISNIQTTHGRKGASLEAIANDGKQVVVFSPDGLNDTAHARNCCCCGGDELDQAEQINVNLLAYALLH